MKDTFFSKACTIISVAFIVVGTLFSVWLAYANGYEVIPGKYLNDYARDWFLTIKIFGVGFIISIVGFVLFGALSDIIVKLTYIIKNK